MKKIVSLVFTLVLLVNAVFIPTIAAETNNPSVAGTATAYTQNEIIEMACEIWPEYSDKLSYSTSEALQLSRASVDFEVVHSDSHKISDTETLLYYEYATGYALAAVAEWDPSVYDTGSGYTEYLANLYIANGISSSHLFGFKYKLNTYAYDQITNFGRRLDSYATVGGETEVEEENATSPRPQKILCNRQSMTV